MWLRHLHHLLARVERNTRSAVKVPASGRDGERVPLVLRDVRAVEVEVLPLAHREVLLFVGSELAGLCAGLRPESNGLLEISPTDLDREDRRYPLDSVDRDRPVPAHKPHQSLEHIHGDRQHGPQPKNGPMYEEHGEEDAEHVVRVEEQLVPAD